MQHFNEKRFMKNLGDSYDAQFKKKVSMHPRNRLAKATKNAQRDDDDVEFIKPVPMHSRDATTNAQGGDDVKLIKQVSAHPREKQRP